MFKPRAIATSDGLVICPMFEVVYLGSIPCMIVYGSIDLKQSITTLPFTDWTGSTTIPTDLLLSISKDFWVSTSVPDNQHPKPGCEWYHPTAI